MVLRRTLLFSLEFDRLIDNTDTALADCSHNIDNENCSKSNKCKFLMDSLFSEVFLIVSVVIVQIKLRSSPEIKDYDYADCRESDVTSGMYIILNSTQDTRHK